MLTNSTLTEFFGPTVPNPSNPIIPSWFDVVWTAFPFVFGAVVLVIVVSIVLNVRRARKHGLNPFTMRTDMAARYIASGTRAAPDSRAPLQDRLAELEALRASGTITEREYVSARSSALNGG
ncbi:hypothetical protein HQQ80_02560 [Microbacteriaceae bacterium VKM Ac-2855]|nr:hypothetical protein [Microbacteriaceae bacterium VKM Ac-2855]